MSYIAQQARIQPTDPAQTIAAKLLIWVSGNMPKATAAEIKEQAHLAWNAIHAAWEQPAGDFDAAWAATTTATQPNTLTITEFARMGGSARTEEKIAAARENGKKGGRPRKTPLPA